MVDQQTLAKFLTLSAAEYQRIGFTQDDLSYLGSGAELTEERLAAGIEELRRVPTGIGAQGYFALHGVDFAARKREIARQRSLPDSP